MKKKIVIIKHITFVPTVNTLFLFMLITEHDKMHVLNYEKLESVRNEQEQLYAYI